MKLALHHIEDKYQWEHFVTSRPEANFLQSWNWGVFHQHLGKKVFRVGIFDEQQQLYGVAGCVIETAKRGKYMTIAGGPLIVNNDPAAIQFLFSELAKLAGQEDCVFIRVRPQLILNQQTQDLFRKMKFVEAPMHLTADLTLQLDLTKTEEELLSKMRKNTRYEVRKADKIGVTVTTSQDPDQIQTFYEHQVELAQKHNFVPFSYQFLHEQFKAFVADDQVMLFHSWHENKLLASAFIIFYNQEAVYHYGISTPDNHKLPGSYACQWAAIKEAKQRGCTRYNFWGIAPKDQPEHRFAGVSLFKRGWGGQEIQYVPAQDLPLSWQYKMIKSFELLRKKSRKL